MTPVRGRGATGASPPRGVEHDLADRAGTPGNDEFDGLHIRVEQDQEALGRRVWCSYAQSYRSFGTAAQYTTVPAHCVGPLPDAVDDRQGARLGIPGITAYRAVFADGPVAGRTVLVAVGRGSVGRAAVALARRGGEGGPGRRGDDRCSSSPEPCHHDSGERAMTGRGTARHEPCPFRGINALWRSAR
ncbi:hypothetical protein GCM10020367_07550 [Streptomyces sannanensis]|uniref:Uncharacterized protein n=1 Tax=Streptomyces sannanensis TaxID=285536 RepID=A0ABP6S5C2_9ACTN